ncbi:MAG: CHRD domain-containing protein [Blastocatellia bacterium]
MLKKCLKLSLLLALVGLLPSMAQAQNRRFKTTLIGFEEVPSLSTPAGGTFEMKIDVGDTGFDYELSYSGLVGNALQSHTHFGQQGVTGGIMVFFCTNLGNGPPGTQACPQSGTVTGTISAADVVGPGGQGIAAGEFAEVLRAIRGGAAYVNVHSSVFPGGEIRGQLVPGEKPRP